MYTLCQCTIAHSATGPHPDRTIPRMHRAISVFVSVISVFLWICELSQATSIPIVDSTEAFPFLRSVTTPKQIIRWDAGMSIQLLSSCKLVRITRRGIRCIPPTNNLIEGWQEMFSSHLHSEEAPLAIRNDSYPWSICTPRNDALCVMRNGVRFFPTDTVRVADKSVKLCSNGQGRTLVGELLKNNTQTKSNLTKKLDDISLCDVLDTNLDVIYDPVNNHVFTRQLSNSIWLYAPISIMILIVVVLTAEAVSQRTRSKLSHNIVAWLLLTGLSLIMLTHIDGRMHTFVTVEDRAFVTMSFIYIAANTLYWLFSYTEKTTDQIDKTTSKTTDKTEQNLATPSSETQKDGVNVMVVSIHFATCVLYGTPDNSYVSAFFFVLLFRCLQKLHDAHMNPENWTIESNTVLLLDVAYATGIFSFGVIPHFTNDTESILYAAAQFVICDTVAANYVAHSTTPIDPPTNPPANPPTNPPANPPKGIPKAQDADHANGIPDPLGPVPGFVIST